MLNYSIDPIIVRATSSEREKIILECIEKTKPATVEAIKQCIESRGILVGPKYINKILRSLVNHGRIQMVRQRGRIFYIPLQHDTLIQNSIPRM